MIIPIIAHNLFEIMQVMIGALQAFTDKCVGGFQANRSKAEGWLEQNAIIVTVLNPLIGYQSGPQLVKVALATQRSVRETALEKAAAGELKHRDENRLVSIDEIKSAFIDFRRLTEGGVVK